MLVTSFQGEATLAPMFHRDPTPSQFTRGASRGTPESCFIEEVPLSTAGWPLRLKLTAQPVDCRRCHTETGWTQERHGGIQCADTHAWHMFEDV